MSGSVFFTFHSLTVYSDGTVHRAPHDPAPIPASPSPASPQHVATMDLSLNLAHGTSVRLFLPPHLSPSQKLPILLYFHGGGFIHGSATLPPDHAFLCKLSAYAPVLIVAVEYRLSPEHPLPIPYIDCYEALMWLNEQATLTEQAAASADPWLVAHGDFSRCFLGGDSAGANIAHHVAMRQATGVGFESWCDIRKEEGPGQIMKERAHVEGIILIHPFFTCGEDEPISEVESKFWKLGGVKGDHPFANPLSAEAPSLKCAALPPRTLVALASKDFLVSRGLIYHKALVDAGKEAKLFISPDEDHVFHLLTPHSPNVLPFLDELRDFINLN